MDAHLDPLSTTFCCSPCLLPPACPHRGHLFTVGASLVELGSGSPPRPAGQPSALGTAAPFSRKVTKSCCSLRGGGTAAGSLGQSGFIQPPPSFLDYKLLGAGCPRAVFITLGLRDPSTLTFLDQTLSLERSGSEAPHSPWTGDQVEGAFGDTPRCKPPFRALQGHSPQKKLTSESTSLALKKHKRQNRIAVFIRFMNSFLTAGQIGHRPRAPDKRGGRCPEKDG